MSEEDIIKGSAADGSGREVFSGERLSRKICRKALSAELIRLAEDYIKLYYVDPEENGDAGRFITKTVKNSDNDDSFSDAEKVVMYDGLPFLYGISASLSAEIEKDIKNAGVSFRDRLMELIDESGMTYAEVYRNANLDRKLFSKIRCNENYIPRKKKIIALTIALRLDIDEASDLLKYAGMAFSPSDKGDIIAEFCIKHGIYDINTVNALLDHFGEPVLG